ncbi:hypothetical protein OB920_18955 [Halobacteria archaeon HArc-gm2]|nr:hypothetical protein [Halobacteria archaeon HArc-gm2]
MEENGRDGARLVNDLDPDNRKAILRGSCGLPSVGGVSGLGSDRFHAVGDVSCDLDANEDFLRALSRANTAMDGDDINVVIDSYRRMDDPGAFEEGVATGKIPLEELARKSDEITEIRQVDDGIRFEMERHGSSIEATYHSDGESFYMSYSDDIDSANDLKGMSSQQIGAGVVEDDIAPEYVEDRLGYEVLYAEQKGGTDPGIDMIAKDGDDVVVIEVKFTRKDGNINLGTFDSFRGGDRQMTDGWIQDAFEEEIDGSTVSNDVEDAILIDKDFRKEALIVQDSSSGGVISKGVSDMVIENVFVERTGGAT